jgi:hypothetical protein
MKIGESESKSFFAWSGWRHAAEGCLTAVVRSPSALLYALCILFTCTVFFLSWNQPILDQHGFRQTQTAVSVYWGIVDGWKLAYETPILGAPWSVPFEFPIFQWLVSFVWKWTALPLDNCGRLTSFVFFVGSSWIVVRMLRSLRVRTTSSLLAGSMFLLAPVCLFWGRAFLIESCALFFSLWYLAVAIPMVQSTSESSSLRWNLQLLLCTVLAVVAALTKINTFVVPGLLVAFFATERLLTQTSIREALANASIRRMAFACIFPLFVALAFTLYWVHFSDWVKFKNPIATALTSGTLTKWNFGTVDQRFSSDLWVKAILKRSIPESVGTIGFAVALIFTVFFARGRELALILIFFAAYLTVFLLFPNLQIIHNYYQYSAAVWLICGVAIALGQSSKRQALVFVVAVAFAVGGQLVTLSRGYAKVMELSIDAINSRPLALASAVKSMSQPSDVILIYGLDWSSELAYYSERRTITVPNWGDLFASSFAQRENLAKPFKATLVVRCDDSGGEGLASVIRAAASAPSVDIDKCEISKI